MKNWNSFLVFVFKKKIIIRGVIYSSMLRIGFENRKIPWTNKRVLWRATPAALRATHSYRPEWMALKLVKVRALESASTSRTLTAGSPAPSPLPNKTGYPSFVQLNSNGLSPWLTPHSKRVRIPCFNICSSSRWPNASILGGTACTYRAALILHETQSSIFFLPAFYFERWP